MSKECLQYSTLPVDDILEGFLTLSQRQNQVPVTFQGRCVPACRPSPLPVTTVRSPEPRHLLSARKGTNPQQVSAVDWGAGAAPFVDEVNLVQPLFQKSALLLPHPHVPPFHTHSSISLQHVLSDSVSVTQPCPNVPCWVSSTG